MIHRGFAVTVVVCKESFQSMLVGLEPVCCVVHKIDAAIASECWCRFDLEYLRSHHGWRVEKCF